jgi:hypothetical protein
VSSPFVQFDVSKYKNYKDYWLRCDEYSSDMSFIILWAWKDFFGYEISWEPELLWMRQTKPDLKWLAPAGSWHRDDWEQQLLEHVGSEADFVDVPKSLVQIWQEQLGSRITAVENRNSFEYLYNVEELATLAGNKHMKRRNRVNKFRRQYDAKYVTLTPDMTETVREMQKSWTFEENEFMTRMLSAEGEGILRVLDHWQDLGMTGGAIILDGQMIAYTLAEPVTPDLIMIHYEKGLSEYPGVYQIINKDFLYNDARSYKIVNREEDMGDPGLRQAKMAYEPCGFVEKYNVHWNAGK